MRTELKKFPKEMQIAYKTVGNRPDSQTPSVILDFMRDDIDDTVKNMFNQFKVNTIVDSVDKNLLDLELDTREKKPSLYNDFALEVVKKIMGFLDVDTKKSKELAYYDNNPKVTKLKVRDFTVFGDLSDKTKLEKAEIFADNYGVLEDEDYSNLTEWEKQLFADKVESRADTNLEK